MTERQDDVVRREFAKQASVFGAGGLTLSRADLLDWIVGELDLRREDTVLDIAAGTGHLSRAMAPAVERVVGIDLTPEMLDEARRAAAGQGLANTEFVEGNAVDLPYADGAFPMVTSRLAIHHFDEPAVQVAEMVRVCAPGGRVAVVDMVSTEDARLAETHNRLERLRDPSHTRALSPPELVALFVHAGLTELHSASRNIEVVFERWVEMTRTPADTVSAIRAELEAELAGGPPTGMRPFMDDGALEFRHAWQVSVFLKPA